MITVGALDQAQTSSVSDDTRASWSAYGPTADGFMKPDVSAPGRYMVMPVPMNSAIPAEKANRVVKLGYMWMSGTSFSAPIVAGARGADPRSEPGFTPDQVKGALMLKARFSASADPGAGVGEIDAGLVRLRVEPSEPERAACTSSSPNGTFDAEAWASHVTANANWTAANWTAANWIGATGSARTGSARTGSARTGSARTGSARTGSASNWTVGTDAE